MISTIQEVMIALMGKCVQQATVNQGHGGWWFWGLKGGRAEG